MCIYVSVSFNVMLFFIYIVSCCTYFVSESRRQTQITLFSCVTTLPPCTTYSFPDGHAQSCELLSVIPALL